ncbi:hypothetical protein H4R18_004605 [Coemansia javaensis]|uniref:Transcription initiation factor TFIID subunit 4 n=1 Tax=Coemansia javaensis TaxID=2761396 RepID=A0A9W8LGU7_9FUNG|nr:hypothetical protein H4R18_004605 [Coemansia javaensis]
MADGENTRSSAGTPNATPATSAAAAAAAADASQILFSMSGGAANGLAVSSELDLSSILPGSRPLGSAPHSLAPIPMAADIDQLVRSLGDSVDTSKVSDDDINKLLGSINADFSAGLALPGVPAGIPGADSLGLLSRNLGIGLDAGGASKADEGGAGLLDGAAFSPAQSASLGTLSSHSHSHSSAMDILQGRSGAEVGSPAPAQAQPGVLGQPLAAHPATPEMGGAGAHRSGASTPYSGSQGHTPDASTARGSAEPQAAGQYRPPSARPQPPPAAATSPAARPPPAAHRPPTAQRPPRPMQGVRPMPRPRPPPSDFSAQQQQQQQRPQRPPLPGHGGGPRPGQPRPGVRPGVAGGGGGDSTDPSRWLAATMSTLPPGQQERLAELFRGLQSKAVNFPTFMRDAEAIMGPKFQDMLALMREQGQRPAPTPPPQSQPQSQPQQQPQQQRLQRPVRPHGSPGAPQQSAPSPGHRPGTPTAASGARPVAPQGALADMATLAAHHGGAQGDADRPGAAGLGGLGGMTFETVIARWRQIILNPLIPGEQLVRLSMQLSNFGDLLANPTGPMASISEDERGQQFAQISKLQALIAQRQLVRGPVAPGPQAPGSRPASPQGDAAGRPGAARPAAAGAKKRPGDVLRPGSPAAARPGVKRLRLGVDAGAESDAEQQHQSHLELPGPAAALGSAHASDDDGGGGGADPYRARARLADSARERETQRRARERERRERERQNSGSGSGGNAFSLDDVIGCTGVNLVEESEMILSSGPPHHGLRAHDAYDAPPDDAAAGPALATSVIGSVEVARGRMSRGAFATLSVVEALVARVCQRAHMRAVAADVVPYLSLALQERLRSFMELVTAAAHHRTRTQTLPPPPLDPVTRLPLYKITPHLDVKKQLAVIERIDQLREQARKLRLAGGEQRGDDADRAQQAGDAAAGAAKKGDDGSRPGATPTAAEAAAGGSGSVAPTAGDGSRQSSEAPQHAGGSEPGDAPRGPGAAKRGRKRDDGGSGDAPAYNSKNMPEELQNQISNMTALRAVGGVRKGWMNAATPSWLTGAAASSPADSAPKPPRMAATPEAVDAAAWPGGGGLTPRSATGSGSMDHGAEPRSASTSHSRERSFSGPGASDDPDAHAPRLQAPLAPHRPVTLAAPLLVTVRDCLFSLERERLGPVRVGRGGGRRVLVQSYTKYNQH